MQSWSETSSHNCFNPHTWLQFFFFFNFTIDILKSEQCRNLSLFYVVYDPLARRLSRRRLLRAHRHWQNRIVPSKKCEGRRDPSPIGGSKWVRQGRTMTDADDAVAATATATGIIVCVAALQCDIQPIIHDARFLSTTQPPQTPQHACLSRRIAPRSHRRRRLCSRCLRSLSSPSNRYMWFDVGRQRRSRRPGSRRGESPRRVNEPRLSRHEVVIRRLIVPLVYPGICRGILEEGKSECILGEEKRRGKEKDWKAKEILVRFRLNRSL